MQYCRRSWLDVAKVLDPVELFFTCLTLGKLLPFLPRLQFPYLVKGRWFLSRLCFKHKILRWIMWSLFTPSHITQTFWFPSRHFLTHARGWVFGGTFSSSKLLDFKNVTTWPGKNIRKKGHERQFESYPNWNVIFTRHRTEFHLTKIGNKDT